MALEFWFEFASTYSYPAAMRVEALAAERQVALRWRAFLLGPIFGEQGWNDSPFNLYPAKGRYMWRDLERICDAEGLALRRPSAFPRNGLLAARVACRFADADWLPAFVRSVYRANFEHDADIATADVVARCLTEAGQAPEALLAEAGSPGAKTALRAQTDAARALGIFGAPCSWSAKSYSGATTVSNSHSITPRRVAAEPGAQKMGNTLEPLVLDLLEWLARRPRAHSEVMEVWRTSCPQLPVWEEANARGFIDRRHESEGARIGVSVLGREHLERSR